MLLDFVTKNHRQGFLDGLRGENTEEEKIQLDLCYGVLGFIVLVIVWVVHMSIH